VDPQLRASCPNGPDIDWNATDEAFNPGPNKRLNFDVPKGARCTIEWGNDLDW
jgi:hypothetical protein